MYSALLLYLILTYTSFMNWNIPYGAMKFSAITELGYGSPAAMSTPSDINAFTPNSGNVPSPSDAPTPSSMALTSKTRVERARMFANGRFDELVRSMNKKEGVYVK
jgi:hypothetical protein